jgi:hypothetical protein
LNDSAIKLPKLYVVTVNELPGLVYGGLIIGANQVYGPNAMAVLALNLYVVRVEPV